MPLSLYVPEIIDPEAEAQVEKLGLQPEFRAMLDRIKQVVVGLQSISVSLDPRPEGDDPIILILAALKDPGPDGSNMADEGLESQWDRWAIETFPPDVNRHFCMMAIHGLDDDAR